MPRMHRVLLVHPGEAIRKLTSRMMQRTGVETDLATNVREAASLLDGAPYTVVVIDMATCGAILESAALRAEPKPVVIVHTPADFGTPHLDPDLVTMIVAGGDAATIIGVVLSCVVEKQGDVIPAQLLSSRPSRLPEA